MLSVVHFLRSFFKTPEPGAHLPGEGEIEDNQLPLSPAEPDRQRWSQETDPNDFETLSHQSESRSDTKTDPFESASETESLQGDLTEGVCLPPSGPSVDGEASWKCPDASASSPAPEQHVACAHGLGAEEGLDLTAGFKVESCRNECRAFAAVTGDVEAQHLWNCVTSLEQESLLARDPQCPRCCWRGARESPSPQAAQVLTVPYCRGLLGVSLQKSRSESCLSHPVVWPSPLGCYKLSRSWTHIHNKVRATVPPPGGPLDSASPLWAGTKEESTPGLSLDTDLLWSQPCAQDPCWYPLQKSYPCTKLHHSAPENIGDKDRASPGPHCWPMRTLTKAHSETEFFLGYPEGPLWQNFVKSGAQLEEGTETERTPKTQSTFPQAPTWQSPLLPAPHLQDHYEPSGFSLERASQDTPSAGLQRENQLGQNSKSCPVSSCLPSELKKLGAQEVAAPAVGRSEQSTGSKPGESWGTRPAPSAADVGDEGKHLPDIAVEAGNQTSKRTSKYILSGKRKPLSVAKFPRHSSSGGTRVWNRDLMGGSEVGDSADAPETTLKSSATDTSKDPEEAMVVDPACRKNALQSLWGFTKAKVSGCSTWDQVCDQGPGDGTLAGGQLEPRADVASAVGCALVIAAVQRTASDLQAKGSTVDPRAEIQALHFPEEKPGSSRSSVAIRCGSPRARQTLTDGNESESERPAVPTLSAGDHATQPVDRTAEPGRVLVSRASSKETLSTEKLSEEKPPPESQSPELEGAHPTQGLSAAASWGLQSRELRPGELGAENSELPGAGVSEAPEGGAAGASAGGRGAPASAGAHALQPPGQTRELCKAAHEPGKSPVFPMVTSFRKGRLSATESSGEGSDPRAPGALTPTLEGSTLANSGPEEELPAESRTAEAGWDPASPNHVGGSAAPEIVSSRAGRAAVGPREVEDVGTPGDPSSRRPSSESCTSKRLKTTEKAFRAKLALAHKTFSNFFESKVVEKENTDERALGSLKGEKEKGRSRQSSWRALLRSKDAEGPKRAPSVSRLPGPQVPNPLDPPPQVTSSHSEESAENKNYGFRDLWGPPRPPTPLSPNGLISPEHRRKSEPTIKCTASPEGGRYLPTGIFPEKSWLTSPTSPGAQQAGISRTLPSGSACCLADENQGRPCKPLSPKPLSPRPGVQREDLHYPGRGTAISMVSLGSYSDVDGSSVVPGRPKIPKARTSLLLSLQTLNQEDQKEDSEKRGHLHLGLSAAPSLRDLPGSENHVPWDEPPGRRPSCFCGQRTFPSESAQRQFSTTNRVTHVLPSVSTEDAPKEVPSQPRSTPQHSYISRDDLWLEKTQRKKLEKQAQLVHAGSVLKDQDKDWRKMIIASPESFNVLRRSHPLSQSAPMVLNYMSWPEHVPDTQKSWLGLSHLSSSNRQLTDLAFGNGAGWERKPCVIMGCRSMRSGVVCGGRGGSGGMRGALSRAWSLESLRSATAVVLPEKKTLALELAQRGSPEWLVNDSHLP
ncbi:uncharacterized protein LOC106733149 [Tupaia chinensis]|uniref:uncharacterized protein LOC106733149 n=1 Tax=Tupaia chinensis TaxID=246437 RepID=UPI000FFC7708|nr:uncharacterized protein LOC106733149 [Tupaia chinensis]